MSSRLEKIEEGHALNPKQFADIARSHADAAKCVLDAHYSGKPALNFDTNFTIISMATLLGIGFEASFKGFCELAEDHKYKRSHDLMQLLHRFKSLDCMFFSGKNAWSKVEDMQKWRRAPFDLFGESRDQSDLIYRDDTVTLHLECPNDLYGGALKKDGRPTYSHRYPPKGGSIRLRSYHPPLLHGSLSILVELLEEQSRQWLRSIQ